MKDEVAAELAKKYPELVGDARLSKTDPEKYKTINCPSPWQAYGWETPDGWTDLLVKLIEELHEVVKPYYGTEQSLIIAQVKSKFAELRFYLDRCPEPVSEQVGSIIEKYARLSATTSEISGKPGTSQNCCGWIYTVTEEEAAEIRAEHDRRMKQYAEEAAAEQARLAAMTPEEREAERKQKQEESEKFWRDYQNKKTEAQQERKKLEEAETTTLKKS